MFSKEVVDTDAPSHVCRGTLPSTMVGGSQEKGRGEGEVTASFSFSAAVM